VTGEVLADKPVRGQHVVFALDLSLLVPALVVSGVLLWRRTPIGYVAAGIVSVMGSLVLLNLLLAGAFQANADVAGVRTFPPEGIAMAVGMIASMVLLLGARTQTQGRNRTMKDALTTILAISVGAATLAVTEDWDWALLGSTRAAVGAVGQSDW
jgi:hypothetical protein